MLNQKLQLRHFPEPTTMLKKSGYLNIPDTIHKLQETFRECRVSFHTLWVSSKCLDELKFTHLNTAWWNHICTTMVLFFILTHTHTYLLIVHLSTTHTR